MFGPFGTEICIEGIFELQSNGKLNTPKLIFTARQSQV
jgi:hypothetical protein